MTRLAVRLLRRKGNRIFILYDYIVTDEEIVARHAAGKVTRGNAPNLLREFEQRIETELDSKFGAAQGRALYWNRPWTDT